MNIFQTYQKELSFAIVREKSKRAVSNSQSAANAPNSNRFHSFGWNVVPYFFIGNAMISSAIYFFCEAQTFQEYSDCVFLCSSAALLLCNLTVFIRQRTKIYGLIDSFEQLIQTRWDKPASKAIYQQANTFNEKWSKIACYALKNVTISSVTVPYLIWSYFQYFATDLDRDAFRLPYPYWMPFDWRTPFGYLIAIVIQISCVYFSTLCCICNVCFPIGTCCFMMAIANDIKKEFDDLNDYNHTKEGEIQLNKKIGELIHLHATAKQLVNDFNSIYESIFTLYFLWAAITICDTLLMFQSANDTSNFSAIIQVIFLIFWSFAQICVFSESSEMMTSRFDEINIYQQCDWYSFPVRMQRVLPTIMMNTQRAVVFEGFGNILCTRQTFKKVTNGGFSYFMVLRTLVN